MLRLWRRFTASPATRACHYCGTDSVLVPPYGSEHTAHLAAPRSGVNVSCGTPARWFCAQCGCWNHQDAQGHPLDVWERAMWDPSANKDSFASTSGNRAEKPGVFCRNCLTNQTLVTNLLANYLGSDDEDDAARWAALPEYKRSLEQRYPMACEECANRANAQIAKVNSQVQHQFLGSWVRRQTAPEEEEMDTTVFLTKVRKWKWQRWHWFSVHGASIVLAVSQLLPYRLHEAEWMLAVFLLMPSTYDPAWRQSEAIRLRGAHPVEHGATCWNVRPLC